MTSNGVRLATTTAIISSGLLLAACQQTGPGPVAKISDAPNVRALVEKTMADRQEAAAQHVVRLAASAEVERRAGDYGQAITLAERAIAFDPAMAEVRKTLARSYFAQGRFRSAAEAWSDVLTLDPADPGDAAFGAALTALARGEDARAATLLAGLQSDKSRTADVGLAYVLLGDVARGKAMLTEAVRAGGSTAQTRQNLALAQALSGEWDAARVTAAIDLTPGAVDARVAEWAALSVSADPAWRTKKLLAVTEADVDPGRPVALAVVRPAAPVAAAQVEVAAVTETPVEVAAATVVAPATAPALVVESIAKTPAKPAASKTPVKVAVPTPLVAEIATARLADTVSVTEVDAPSAFARSQPMNVAKTKTVAKPRPKLQNVNAFTVDTGGPVKPKPVKTNKTEVTLKEAAEPTMAKRSEAEPVAAAAPLPEAGDGNWLVQLGSYDRVDWVKENWQVLKTQNDFLADYRPVRSKADVDGRTYYRLSVGRFGTSEDAKTLCEALKAKGTSCFVREGKFNGSA
ncbi:MAG: SPOR domain-containing protein [Pacificimonas sp.]